MSRREWQAAKKAHHRPFDFDQYYPAISNHTWRSLVLPFPPELARACLNYYQARFNNRRHLLLPEDAALLRGLEASLDEHMAALGGSGFFVRMSNRSPKDGMPLERGALRRQFLTALGEDEGASCSSSELLAAHSPNELMVAFSGAVSMALRVRNGREAMCLLLTSERVFLDLNLAMDCAADAGDEWGTYLIVREWDEQLRHDWEFRCFVKDRRLYAISQYNHYCVFAGLTAACEGDGASALRKDIFDYWNAVKGSIEAVTGPDYVIDLALLADGRWRVVELNPHATDTGGCLYHWDELKQIHPREGGDCDFRIKCDVMDNLDQFVEACVMPQLDEHDTSISGESIGPWEEYLQLAEPEPVQTKTKAGCCMS